MTGRSDRSEGYGDGVTDALREERAAPDRTAADERVDTKNGRQWWCVPPVDRAGLIVWLVAYVAMSALAIGVGLLIVHELGGVRGFDDRVARWFARRRDGTGNTITWF